jgi:hypothetical protein
MKKLLTTIIALAIGLGAIIPTMAATTDEKLQQILQLLDQELAQWEQDNFAPSNQELKNAVKTIYDMGITKFDEPVSYMATNAIRRDEAATMFYRYLSSTRDLVDGFSAEQERACTFPDINQAHSDLR